jgi:hypothetical protein
MININVTGTTSRQNISTTKLIAEIERLEQELNSGYINNEEILSLLKKVKEILSPVSRTKTTSNYVGFKEMISRKKWVFSVAIPYIIKIIEILLAR